MTQVSEPERTGERSPERIPRGLTLCGAILVGLWAFSSCQRPFSGESGSFLESQNSESSAVARRSVQRAALLEQIALRIAANPRLGNGPGECAQPDFAFGVSKANYERDAFELRASFLTGNKGCTDARQTRPPLVLSSGNPALPGLLNDAELKVLGLKGAAAPGEVIVANFFHLKRFWIARIPVRSVSRENVIFQLEHFKVVDTPESESAAAANAFARIRGVAQGKLIDWINNNLAGHTQIRIHFPSQPVLLTEQVLKKGQRAPRTLEVRDIVLSAEAQGTTKQVGKEGYDPIKAINPLFFSVNRLVSLHEKYADMVVRQGNRVQQWTVAGAAAPSPEELLSFYLKMAASNWRAMTRAVAQEQGPAIYSTVDFNPFDNKAKNCTTEVIAALEAGREQGLVRTIRARLQDLTLQRLYPMTLGNVLREMEYLGPNAKLPNMDANPSVGGRPQRFLSPDQTLHPIRQHFLENGMATCRSYFEKDEDKAQCAVWKAQLGIE